MKKNAVVFGLLVMSGVALAKRPVPLLPPPSSSTRQQTHSRSWYSYRSHVSYSSPREKAVPDLGERTATTQTESTVKRGYVMDLGLELGAIGQKNSAGEFLGMQWLYGGRLTARLPLGYDLYLKPSVGYFRRSAATGGVSVTQHMIEAGAGLLYRLGGSGGFRWLAGLSTRMDFPISNVSLPGGQTSSSPLSARFRLGPATTFNFSLSRDVGLALDLEATSPLVSPLKVNGSAALGVIFRWR